MAPRSAVNQSLKASNPGLASRFLWVTALSKGQVQNELLRKLMESGVDTLRDSPLDVIRLEVQVVSI